MSWTPFVPLALASLGCFGCGGSQIRPEASSAGTAHIEALVLERCVTCHKAPKAASLDRPDAETVIGKHRAKLQLGEPDWTAVVERLTRD